MAQHYILNERGEPEPCDDLMRWAQFFNDGNARRVAFDYAGDGVEVSTVFLGIDHRLGPGAPLLFETLIFGGEYDETCRRYSTRAEAQAGHAAVVAALVAGRDPWEEAYP